MTQAIQAVQPLPDIRVPICPKCDGTGLVWHRNWDFSWHAVPCICSKGEALSTDWYWGERWAMWEVAEEAWQEQGCIGPPPRPPLNGALERGRREWAETVIIVNFKYDAAQHTAFMAYAARDW